MSICKKTITLIFLDLQLIHHFIDGTCIATNYIIATTFLVLFYCYTVSLLLLLYNCYHYCRPTVTAVRLKLKLIYD
jgi:hypothetical protein